MKLREFCTFCNKKSLKIKHDFGYYSVVECDSCGFLFRDRILSHKEEEKLYDKNYYLKLQKEYFLNCLTPNPKDKSRIKDFESRLDLLENLLKKGAAVNLLDIGAGTGVFGYLAQKRGWQTLNAEISAYALNIAKSKFKVKTFRGEITDKKFTGGNYDLITLWESIANIENTPRLLRTIRKLLNNHGKVAILTTVADSWLYDAANLIHKLSFSRIKYFVKEGFPIHHANHFTRAALKKALHKEGFKVIYQSNQEIPYKYTKLPKIFQPLLIILGKLANIYGRTIQVLLIAQKA